MVLALAHTITWLDNISKDTIGEDKELFGCVHLTSTSRHLKGSMQKFVLSLDKKSKKKSSCETISAKQAGEASSAERR